MWLCAQPVINVVIPVRLHIYVILTKYTCKTQDTIVKRPESKGKQSIEFSMSQTGVQVVSDRHLVCSGAAVGSCCRSATRNGHARAFL